MYLNISVRKIYNKKKDFQNKQTKSLRHLKNHKTQINKHNQEDNKITKIIKKSIFSREGFIKKAQNSSKSQYLVERDWFKKRKTH